MGRRRPILIYDGDCGFCKYWLRYWNRLTGDRVAYAPYQEVAAQYPEIPVAEFKRAVKYIAADGKVASGAEAALLTLSLGGKGFWLTLYRDVEPQATLPEYKCVEFVEELLYRDLNGPGAR